ncbi:hypothetical protein HK096_002919, partial [Nowakowskiella sp. JEL0078]
MRIAIGKMQKFLIGSGYTVIAVVTYSRKKKSISDSLRQIHSNIQSPHTPISAHSPHFETNYSSSVASPISTAYNHSSSSGSPTTAGQSILCRESANLAQILHRMVVWCVGYHALAMVYLVQTVYAVISDLITPSVNNPQTRANTVIYSTFSLSLLLFVCFGTGRSAVERYQSWLGIKAIKKILNSFDVEKDLKNEAVVLPVIRPAAKNIITEDKISLDDQNPPALPKKSSKRVKK